MVLPLAVMVPLASSTVIVPWNWPCTESRRSSEARLTRSSPTLPPPRTTIARSRSPLPEPDFSMSSRATRRPMRPKP